MAAHMKKNKVKRKVTFDFLQCSMLAVLGGMRCTQVCGAPTIDPLTNICLYFVCCKMHPCMRPTFPHNKKLPSLRKNAKTIFLFLRYKGSHYIWHNHILPIIQEPTNNQPLVVSLPEYHVIILKKPDNYNCGLEGDSTIF